MLDAWILLQLVVNYYSIKDTHMENAPQNKTQTIKKNINMDIQVVCTLGKLFIRSSYTKVKFSKNQVVSGITPFFVIGPFCTSHSICLTIGFWQSSFVRKYCVFNRSTFNSKMVLQFLKKAFRFSENLFQSNENAQNLQWLSHKKHADLLNGTPF